MTYSMRLVISLEPMLHQKDNGSEAGSTANLSGLRACMRFETAQVQIPLEGDSPAGTSHTP